MIMSYHQTHKHNASPKRNIILNAMAFPNKVDAFPRLSKTVRLPEKKVPAEMAGSAEAGGRRRRGGRRGR